MYKYFKSVVIMSVFSCSCYSATSASTEEMTAQQPKRARTTMENFVLSQEDMRQAEERIQHKAKQLKPCMEQANSELQKIGDKLSEKARSLMQPNLVRAVELAQLVGNVKVMISSALGIHRNLEGHTSGLENPLLNMSVAIIASTALRESFNQLIEVLNKPDTQDIDCRALGSLSTEMYTITKDIQIPAL